MDHRDPSPLWGNAPERGNVVRMVYADEAGISHPEQEPYVVVSALVVHADHQLIDLEKRLDALVAKHIPKEHQEGFVFHAFQLFGGYGVFDQAKNPEMTLAKRLAIADELAAIPKDMYLRIAYGSVERARFAELVPLPRELTVHERTVGSHVSAYLIACCMIEQWMRQTFAGEVVLMIVEDNQNARTLIREVQIAHQRKGIMKSLPDRAKRFFPFRHIKQNPLFEQKVPSSPLQLSDFCAYVYKRHLMNDARYERLMDVLTPQIVTYSEAKVK